MPRSPGSLCGSRLVGVASEERKGLYVCGIHYSGPYEKLPDEDISLEDGKVCSQCDSRREVDMQLKQLDWKAVGSLELVGSPDRGSARCIHSTQGAAGCPRCTRYLTQESKREFGEAVYMPFLFTLSNLPS